MQRYAYFDNAKGIFIVLVVFGHLIQPFVHVTTGIQTTYTWIYTFHMPAFILLSGFFAKGMRSVQDIGRFAKQLIVPYILFQLVYTAYYFWIGKANWTTDGLFVPHWSLWFLLSLFSWHVLLTIFRRWPAKIALTIAVGIGLVVGYYDEIGHAFSLSRTFVFFPFFLAGYYMNESHIRRLVQPNVRLVALVLLIGSFVTLYMIGDVDTGWWLASKSYATLGAPVTGAVWRLLVYSISALMVLCTLSLIPTTHWRFTVIGERTLYVYLLHGFFIQWARLHDLFTVDTTFDLLPLLVVAIALVLLLSSRPIITLTAPIIEIRSPFYDRKSS